MPIYEYACVGCGKRFEEIVVRKSDETDIACPGCASKDVSRIVSRPAATKTSGDRGSAAPSCGPVG